MTKTISFSYKAARIYRCPRNVKFKILVNKYYHTREYNFSCMLDAPNVLAKYQTFSTQLGSNFILSFFLNVLNLKIYHILPSWMVKKGSLSLIFGSPANCFVVWHLVVRLDRGQCLVITCLYKSTLASVPSVSITDVALMHDHG